MKRSCKGCPHIQECDKRCKALRNERIEKHFASSIGKAIYELRATKGWSQKKLAEELGISQPNIGYWEKGCYNRKPTGRQALKLRDLSGWPIERFLELTDDKVYTE